MNKKQYLKKYYQEHKKELKEYRKKWYQAHRELTIKRSKEYNKKHKEKKKEHYKKYRKRNKIKLQTEQRKYYQENKEEIKKKRKKYYKNNKEKMILCSLQYVKIRRKKDINFRLKCCLRKRLWEALKNNSKTAKTLKLLDCTIPELKQHLEKQFKKGMAWENYGFYGWHIDHIRPCYKFDLSKESEQKKCFHYSNLQPLWAKENLNKGKK